MADDVARDGTPMTGRARTVSRSRRGLCGCIMLLVTVGAYAGTSTPIGSWTQIDPSARKPESSIVKIAELPNGTLEGVVQKVLSSSRGTNPICKPCTGARRDKPMVGMVVIWGVRRHGDTWDGGWVLDPINGKSYRVRLTPAADGRKLKGRAYVGIPLFGRTQVWVRRAGGPAGSTARQP